MDEVQTGEVQTDEVQTGEAQILDIETINIGIGTLIGKGTYKTVYSCIETNDVNNIIFVLPDNTTVDKLCIAVLDINEIILKKYSKEKIIVNAYIKNPQKFNNIIKNVKNIEKWKDFINIIIMVIMKNTLITQLYILKMN